MELTYGLPLLALLIFGLYNVHRMHKRSKAKRRLLRSAIGGGAMRFKGPEASARSEMRAYDDPTTVMGNIRTTTSSPGLRPSRKSKRRRK